MLGEGAAILRSSVIAKTRRTPRASSDVQVAGRRGERAVDGGRDAGERLDVTRHASGEIASCGLVAVRAGARLALLGQEVGAHLVEDGDRARRRRSTAPATRARAGRTTACAYARVRDRPVGKERGEAAGHAVQSRPARASRPRARSAIDVEIGRRAAQIAIERRAHHQAAIEQVRPARRAAAPGASRASTSATCASSRATRRQARSAWSSASSTSRAVSASSATRKPGIEAGLERELAQQAIAERVDGADGDVAERDRAARSQRAAARSLACAAPRSAAMMRSRISAAAFRVKVIARMFTGSTPAREQVQVALHQHRGLAGAGRRLEHDVVRGSVAKRAGRGVARQQRRRRRGAPAQASSPRPRGRRRRSAASNSPGCSLLFDIVLPAHRRKAAVHADVRLVRRSPGTRRARCRAVVSRERRRPPWRALALAIRRP